MQHLDIISTELQNFVLLLDRIPTLATFRALPRPLILDRSYRIATAQPSPPPPS